MDDFRSQVDLLLSSLSPRPARAKALAELIRAWAGFHWVGLYDVSETHLSAVAWTGNEAPAFPSFQVSKGINGAAVAQKVPVIVQDVSQDSRYLTTFGATRAEAIFPCLLLIRRMSLAPSTSKVIALTRSTAFTRCS